jgi:hypothetical protein
MHKPSPEETKAALVLDNIYTGVMQVMGQFISKTPKPEIYIVSYIALQEIISSMDKSGVEQVKGLAEGKYNHLIIKSAIKLADTALDYYTDIPF